MLAEAGVPLNANAYRAALLLAWAALEAALRRTALRAGLQGRIGVQPSVLLRELFAAGKITEDEYQLLEHLRSCGRLRLMDWPQPCCNKTWSGRLSKSHVEC